MPRWLQSVGEIVVRLILVFAIASFLVWGSVILFGLWIILTGQRASAPLETNDEMVWRGDLTPTLVESGEGWDSPHTGSLYQRVTD